MPLGPSYRLGVTFAQCVGALTVQSGADAVAWSADAVAWTFAQCAPHGRGCSFLVNVRPTVTTPTRSTKGIAHAMGYG